MVVEFSVTDFFPCPIKKERNGKVINDLAIREFWENNGYGEEVGCYVFASKAGLGMKPLYVGKTAKTFRQEIFTSEKIKKYQTAFAKQMKGTFGFFFVVLNSKRGPVNNSVICKMEKFLIETASNKNPDGLLNKVHNRKSVSWRIKGVVNATRGQPSCEAQCFKSCMGL